MLSGVIEYRIYEDLLVLCIIIRMCLVLMAEYGYDSLSHRSCDQMGERVTYGLE